MRRILLVLSILALSYCPKLQAASATTATFYRAMSRVETDSLSNWAFYYIQRGQQDSAFVCYTVLANRLYEQPLEGDEALRGVMAWNNLGYMYYFCYYDYQKSFRYLQQALKASKEFHQEEAQVSIYLNLANLYHLSSDYMGVNDFCDTIITYYKKSLYGAIRFEDERRTLVAFYGLAHYAYWAGKTADIMKEVALIEHVKIDKSYALMKFDLDFCGALRCLQRKQYRKALDYLKKMIADNNARDTRERYDIMTYERMADVCCKLKDYRQAFVYLRQAEKLAIKADAKDLVVYINKNFLDLYQATGDKANYDAYEIKYLKSKEALVSEGKLKMVEKMHFMGELDKANEKMVTLHHQQERQRIILVAVGMVAIILVISVILIMRSYRKLQASYRQLYQRSIEMLQRHETAQPKEGEAKKPNMDEETLSQQRTAIEEVMSNNPEIYSFDFTLTRLAELTGIKYWQLSKIIKDVYDKNFNTLLNEYRIREACRRLNDIEHYGKYSIGGIATSVGFKSRPNFVTIFKNIVGMTPTDYKKIAKDVQE